MDELTAAREAISRVEETSKGEVHASEITFLIQSISIISQTVVKSEATSVCCLATGEEFAGSSLCLGRPEPGYYDLLYLWRELKENMFVLIRPHRKVSSMPLVTIHVAQLQKLVNPAVAYLHE
ncbi:Monooxygenase FAD-binding [Penicillium pulvis]|uniref:Monooxygenase FAD-binding n=1 Tax=Penicillium pulvis TaxID=1562058 RepID=UPI0025485474|nr:Monooxygenase FAD-binding [Penicillium pulvis]KAJ5798661.1 Monooxygenase FAD-binding [Penicillium pulvis]